MKNLYYDIFKTRWGWFGLLGNNDGLIRTCLPMADKGPSKADYWRISRMQAIKNTLFSIKSKIINYYNGQKVNFSRTKVSLEGLTEFQQHVLITLRTVTYRNTISYSQLAQMANNPKAARAIGSVMAKNPISLIIPCHRVIKADGTIGQFSASGSTNTKIRMIKLEESS